MTNWAGSDRCAELKRAVFLDRDGTLIDTEVRDGRPFALGDTSSHVILDGVVEGCARLRARGYALVLITNQPDIARGKVAADVVHHANSRIVEALGLDLAMVCPHDDDDGCPCRKPLPGMLEQAAAELGLLLDRRSCMIGDRWRDIDAGAAAGITTVFIERGYDEPLRKPPDHSARSFRAAVSWVLDDEGVRNDAC